MTTETPARMALISGMCYLEPAGSEYIPEKLIYCDYALPSMCKCKAYLFPDAWHRKGGCPLCTLKSGPEGQNKETKKVNPLKQSKRNRKGA
jgi:hypothetical protein